MTTFRATLQKVLEKEAKMAALGWTYVVVPAAVAQTLKPNRKTSFRVQGRLDNHPIRQVALLPMGNGDFMLVVNAEMRRGLRKEAGATIEVSIEADETPMPLSADLLACLTDDPQAQAFFDTLSNGHQRYFSNWIEDAKTPDTRTKRLTQAIRGLSMQLGFGEMMRYFKRLSEERGET